VPLYLRIFRQLSLGTTSLERLFYDRTDSFLRFSSFLLSFLFPFPFRFLFFFLSFRSSLGWAYRVATSGLSLAAHRDSCDDRGNRRGKEEEEEWVSKSFVLVVVSLSSLSLPGMHVSTHTHCCTYACVYVGVWSILFSWALTFCVSLSIILLLSLPLTTCSRDHIRGRARAKAFCTYIYTGCFARFAAAFFQREKTTTRKWMRRRTADFWRQLLVSA
jgi:hypothetical protein